ncbi:SIMPL domain-containing protein [Anaeromicropila herbilytica]|uniref:SIMPL domain-containing protein n=1 Tax=Anaeromicropila herbilytica TaxID=2785025 RepID=A0A7R7EJC1_9FIRM|nr:SIMPL domain-containing protein [Anaeromicropila herbilytica]BCN29746.1 SIMPL domain-containing protein [Anaeromicropila herbilytica]
MNPSYNDNPLKYKIMTLTGEGQVSAVPDIATIRLGVQTNGANLEEIQIDNAKISQNVIDAIRSMGVKDIKTVQYIIDKNYEYQDGKQIDKGYVVRNIFEITISDMKMIGKVIDTAVKSGANVVDLITFQIANSDYFYQEALNLAVINAIQKATSFAMNLGYSLAPIPTRIVENTTSPIPYSEVRLFKEASTVTPIEPGENLIKASVTVDFVY